MAPPINTLSSIFGMISGALINASDVIIRAYRTAYEPTISTSNFIWQGKEEASKGWKIGINGFTGRAKFCLGGENVAE